MRSSSSSRFQFFLACCLALGLSLVALHGRAQTSTKSKDEGAEFHFARMIYTDLPQYGGGRGRGRARGWWRQDWPEAEMYFGQAIERLTRIDIGQSVTIDLLSDDLYDYPWLYATQVGYWSLSDEELAALREYLARGGFLVVDDFFDQEWGVFQQTMSRLYPDRPIVEIEPGSEDEILHVVYDLDEKVQIPGLRHLRGYRGGGFSTMNLPEPHWRGIFDDEGRLIIAINYNMDIGDAWEEANNPRYPEPMTALSYRFAVNYSVYAMTH